MRGQKLILAATAAVIVAAVGTMVALGAVSGGSGSAATTPTPAHGNADSSNRSGPLCIDWCEDSSAVPPELTCEEAQACADSTIPPECVRRDGEQRACVPHCFEPMPAQPGATAAPAIARCTCTSFESCPIPPCGSTPPPPNPGSATPMIGRACPTPCVAAATPGADGGAEPQSMPMPVCPPPCAEPPPPDATTPCTPPPLPCDYGKAPGQVDPAIARACPPICTDGALNWNAPEWCPNGCPPRTPQHGRPPCDGPSGDCGMMPYDHLPNECPPCAPSFPVTPSADALPPCPTPYPPDCTTSSDGTMACPGGEGGGDGSSGGGEGSVPGATAPNPGDAAP